MLSKLLIYPSIKNITAVRGDIQRNGSNVDTPSSDFHKRFYFTFTSGILSLFKIGPNNKI